MTEWIDTQTEKIPLLLFAEGCRSRESFSDTREHKLLILPLQHDWCSHHWVDQSMISLSARRVRLHSKIGTIEETGFDLARPVLARCSLSEIPFVKFLQNVPTLILRSIEKFSRYQPIRLGQSIKSHYGRIRYMIVTKRDTDSIFIDQKIHIQFWKLIAHVVQNGRITML